MWLWGRGGAGRLQVQLHFASNQGVFLIVSFPDPLKSSQGCFVYLDS